MTYLIVQVYVKNYTNLSGPIETNVVYTKIRQKDDVTDLTGAVYIENDTYHEQLDPILTMMKTRQDNNVTDCKDVVSIKNETGLP